MNKGSFYDNVWQGKVSGGIKSSKGIVRKNISIYVLKPNTYNLFKWVKIIKTNHFTNLYPLKWIPEKGY